MNESARRLCEKVMETGNAHLAWKLMALTLAGDESVVYFGQHRNLVPPELRGLLDDAIEEAHEGLARSKRVACDEDREALQARALQLVDNVQVVYLKDGVTYEKIGDVR